MFQHSLSYLAVLLSALVLLVTGTVQAQNDLRPITFFMTYIPNIQFAPIYVAIEKGYFAAEGIEVTIEHGDEPDGINLIAAGERQFGMISGEQVIAARANDRPVVFVYEWFEKYPVGIVVSGSSEIATPEDLQGRKVGIPGPFGASYTGLIALLRANGLTESDIQLESIGFNAPEVFCVGAVEAATIYVNNEPIQINNLVGQSDCGDVSSISVFNVSDYANMVSNGIVTNEETIANDPELIRSFVFAFHQGLIDTINNPAEAYLLTLDYVESLPRSERMLTELQGYSADLRHALLEGALPNTSDVAAAREAMITSLRDQFSSDELLQLEILIHTIALWESDRLGYSDIDSWQLTEDVLLQMGLLSSPIDIAASYTNDFVPGG